MESAQTKVNYVVYTKVNRVEECFRQEHVGGVGKDAHFERVSLGWFLFLEGSYEGLQMGKTKPDFAWNDKVKITFEKV